MCRHVRCTACMPVCLCVVDETDQLFPNSWCSTHAVSGTHSGLIVSAGNDVLEKYMCRKDVTAENSIII